MRVPRIPPRCSVPAGLRHCHLPSLLLASVYFLALDPGPHLYKAVYTPLFETGLTKLPRLP